MQHWATAKEKQGSSREPKVAAALVILAHLLKVYFHAKDAAIGALHRNRQPPAHILQQAMMTEQAGARLSSWHPMAQPADFNTAAAHCWRPAAARQKAVRAVLGPSSQGTLACLV
jgi:hypothetical protein